MESRTNKILGRLNLAAAVSACEYQQFGTHSHRICEAQTLGNGISVSIKTGHSSEHTAGCTCDRRWWKACHINGFTHLCYTMLDIRCTHITSNSNQRTKNRHLHISFNIVVNHKCRI